MSIERGNPSLGQVVGPDSGTRDGPKGQKVSKDLERDHCPPPFLPCHLQAYAEGKGWEKPQVLRNPVVHVPAKRELLVRLTKRSKGWQQLAILQLGIHWTASTLFD